MPPLPKPPVVLVKKVPPPPLPPPHPHHPYKIEKEYFVLPEDVPPSGVVLENSGPPVCGVSGVSCNSEAIRTSCWVSESSLSKGKEVDIGGFISKMGPLRDHRTLATEAPFSCQTMDLQEFGRTHSTDASSTLATRPKDEVENADNVDTLAPEMYTGIGMFKRRPDSPTMPLCGTIDLISNYMGGQSGGSNFVKITDQLTSGGTSGGSGVGGHGQGQGQGNECTNVLYTSCDHTVSNNDPNGEHRIVKDDTLDLYTSLTTRVVQCDAAPVPTEGTKKTSHKFYIHVETKRKLSFANNTKVTLRGDLFNKKKIVLRGQFDFVHGSTVVRTTLDLREDLNVGDLLGVRLPGTGAVFESVVQSRPNEFTLIMGQSFLGEHLMGYSGHLTYVQHAVSGRLLGTMMGEGMLIKPPPLKVELNGLKYPPPPRIKETFALEVDNGLEARALCNDIHNQYHSLVRMIGKTVLRVTGLNGINGNEKEKGIQTKTPSITVDKQYCNDNHLGRCAV